MRGKKNVKSAKNNISDSTKGNMNTFQKTDIYEKILKKDINIEIFSRYNYDSKYNHDAEEVIYFGSEKV
jgi:hypothetical protein